LRAYGQKDPLTEYKTEAFYMFEGLMSQIKREVLTNLFRSAAGLLAFEQMMRSMPQKLTHEAPPSAMGEHSDEHGIVEETKKEFHMPVHREAPKVGRNDPCPNHPDKKYKNCCGKE
jgi:preprotein translocase subunit SecA